MTDMATLPPFARRYDDARSMPSGASLLGSTSRPNARRYRIEVRFALDEIGKTRRAIKQRLDADQPVVAARQMRPHARPRPVLGLTREPRWRRVQRDIASGGDQMVFIHRDRSATGKHHWQHYP